jgi:hypothetical protein
MHTGVTGVTTTTPNHPEQSTRTHLSMSKAGSNPVPSQRPELLLDPQQQGEKGAEDWYTKQAKAQAGPEWTVR